MWVPAEDGFRQGSPLSCMLAALAGVKCVRAAQQTMDQFYGLERGLDGGDTGDATVQTPEHIEQMRVVHDLAARASEAVAMLDDASFVQRSTHVIGVGT
eukprot:COSAG02_NODE_1711_length_11223_cov_5.622348_6_plen_99_part_00